MGRRSVNGEHPEGARVLVGHASPKRHSQPHVASVVGFCVCRSVTTLSECLSLLCVVVSVLIRYCVYNVLYDKGPCPTRAITIDLPVCTRQTKAKLLRVWSAYQQLHSHVPNTTHVSRVASPSSRLIT